TVRARQVARQRARPRQDRRIRDVSCVCCHARASFCFAQPIIYPIGRGVIYVTGGMPIRAISSSRTAVFCAASLALLDAKKQILSVVKGQKLLAGGIVGPRSSATACGAAVYRHGRSRIARMVGPAAETPPPA